MDINILCLIFTEVQNDDIINYGIFIQKPAIKLRRERNEKESYFNGIVRNDDHVPGSMRRNSRRHYCTCSRGNIKG